jgi:hypothetical protein
MEEEVTSFWEALRIDDNSIGGIFIKDLLAYLAV